MSHILGMGFYHPENRIDNKFIEKLDIGTNGQWIVEKIGIATRASTVPLEYIKTTRNKDPRAAIAVASMTPAEMGVRASKMALERAGVTADKIGLVICNCCTPSKVVPCEATRIARSLGIDGNALDVFTACPAFAPHVDFIQRFASNIPDYILCVSTAALTQNVDYNDRSAGAIWGDGAAAWVISKKHTGRLKVIDSFFMADPTRCEAVVVDTYGYFHQDGRAVRDFSVRQTVRLIKNIEVQFGIDWSRDIFIGHQANATMLEQITANRGIPSSNHWHNVETVGNQAGAGAPASLAAHWDEIKPGQKIVVAVVGAGLSWGSVVLEGQ